MNTKTKIILASVSIVALVLIFKKKIFKSSAPASNVPSPNAPVAKDVVIPSSVVPAHVVNATVPATVIAPKINAPVVSDPVIASAVLPIVPSAGLVVNQQEDLGNWKILQKQMAQSAQYSTMGTWDLGSSRSQAIFDINANPLIDPHDIGRGIYS